MALFDIDISCSPQICTLEAFAKIVARCNAFQHLCERYSEMDAAEKVILGDHDAPWDNIEYSEEELANIFCEAQIWAPQGEPVEEYEDTGNIGVAPYRRGDIAIRVRRYLRPAELSGDRRALYLQLLGAAELLGQEIFDKAKVTDMLAPQILGIVSTNIAYGPHPQAAAQGSFVSWAYVVRWGDFEAGE